MLSVSCCAVVLPLAACSAAAAETTCLLPCRDPRRRCVIQAIDAAEGAVSFRLELTTPACPIKDDFERAVGWLLRLFRVSAALCLLSFGNRRLIDQWLALFR